ncbi:hypothetical protein [Chitinolyticbacter meiyuanensis]|uniref:hypothetical protein n=1 Tax=Chitinolyticbacter meiyuanensis TaxID=682798 RepID=UPI0011E5F318|nr:hypothetical protein [Chitinolyticbacter meiyuanensis]
MKIAPSDPLPFVQRFMTSAGTTAPEAAASESAASPSTYVTLSCERETRATSLFDQLTDLSQLKRRRGLLSDDQRKAAARARIAMIKAQIEQMQQFAAGLDPKAAKAMLSQLRGLAAQLKAAAATLANSGGGATGNLAQLPVAVQGATGSAAPTAQGAVANTDTGSTAPEAAAAPTGSTPTDAAVAEQAVTATQQAETALQEATSPTADALAKESEKGEERPIASGASVTATGRGDAGSGDGDLIRSAARKLKSLMALLKSQIVEDKEKNARKIDQELAEIEQLAKQADEGGQSTEGASNASPATSEAAVTIGADVATPVTVDASAATDAGAAIA